MLDELTHSLHNLHIVTSYTSSVVQTEDSIDTTQKIDLSRKILPCGLGYV